MTLLAHPLADIFPMLPPDDAEALMLDIAENGLSEKIVIHEGRILDGRNRYAALCEIAEIGGFCGGERLGQNDLEISTSPYLVPYMGHDPLAFVLSRNLHRRHLNESQRAMVAARIAELRPGRPTKKGSNLGHFGQRDAAEALHVSRSSVQSARHIREHAAPEVVDAVARGDLAVSAAEALSRLPAEEQAPVIREAGDPKALKRVVKDLRASAQADKADRREAREVELAGRIAALPDKRYGVILADPEWRFEPWSRASGMDRAADNHYPTTDLEAIEARPVCNIAAAVGQALDNWDDLPIGDTRNLSGGARLLRRMTIHLAASRISYTRIAAALGVIKQAVGRQALEARRQIAADAVLAEAMARAETAVGEAAE